MTFENCVEGLNPGTCELEVLHENEISVRKMTSLRFGWGLSLTKLVSIKRSGVRGYLGGGS